MTLQKYTKKEREEKIFEYLRAYYEDKFDRFKQGESPDFQNEADGIGIEMIEAISSESGKQRAFCCEAQNCNNSKEVSFLSDKKYESKFKENINYKEDKPCGWFISENVDPNFLYCENLLYDAIEKKLKKCKSYKKFKTNTLLIICNEIFLDYSNECKEYIQTHIIKKINELEDKYNNKFDEYMLLRLINESLAQLYYIKNDSVTFYNLSETNMQEHKAI